MSRNTWSTSSTGGTSARSWIDVYMAPIAACVADPRFDKPGEHWNKYRVEAWDKPEVLVRAAAVESPNTEQRAQWLAEALADLAPEALAAVSTGVAESNVLAVPGLRALAARGGSSRAVVAARTVVMGLATDLPGRLPR